MLEEVAVKRPRSRKRLETMSPMSAEATVSGTMWMAIALPWFHEDAGNLSTDEGRSVCSRKTITVSRRSRTAS